jgi:hypothetical protein
MEVSFIFSKDELHTLISMVPDRSETGLVFMEKTLSGAHICDLSGLVEKKLARQTDGELALEPVIRMIADSLAHAEYIIPSGDGCDEVYSRWAALRCETYIYKKDCFKITPFNPS